MNLIATHLAKRFLKRELIAEEFLEWCIYGIEKRLSMFTTWTLLILLGSYCFGFRRTISFAVCFVTLRKYSNGYHAKTYIHCLLLSLILQSVSMILIKALPTKFFGFVWIFSDFVILKIAPVNNNQLHLTQSELSALKERIPYVLFFVNLTCIILRSPPIEKTLSNELEGLTAAMLSDALTLLIFVLKKIYGRIIHGNESKKSNEKIS
jgi:accessory gene regulator B